MNKKNLLKSVYIHADVNADTIAEPIKNFF